MAGKNSIPYEGPPLSATTDRYRPPPTATGYYRPPPATTGYYRQRKVDYPTCGVSSGRYVGDVRVVVKPYVGPEREMELFDHLYGEQMKPSGYDDGAVEKALSQANANAGAIARLLELLAEKGVLELSEAAEVVDSGVEVVSADGNGG